MNQQFIQEGLRRTIFGLDCSTKLGGEIKLLDASRALVLIDPYVLHSGIANAALESLNQANIKYEIYSNITREPEPTEADIAAQLGRELKAQVVVGIGGGSTLDIAKATSVLITNEGLTRDYIGIDLIKKAGLPTICLPTTAGTGSETTFTAVFTQRAIQFKGGINSRLLYPHTAILDPKLTTTCPPYITAITGMDALVHAIEAYTSRSATPISNLNALAAIKLINNNLRQSVAHSENLQSRENMLMGSHLAGLALASAGVGLVHAMAYSLGALYNIPHGEANAVLFPFVLKYNLIACPERFATIAETLIQLPKDITTRNAALVCIKEIKELSHDIGIPSNLTQLGIPQSEISTMAAKAMTVTRPIANNPREAIANDLEIIYRLAFEVN